RLGLLQIWPESYSEATEHVVSGNARRRESPRETGTICAGCHRKSLELRFRREEALARDAKSWILKRLAWELTEIDDIDRHALEMMAVEPRDEHRLLASNSILGVWQARLDRPELSETDSSCGGKVEAARRSGPLSAQQLSR